jgi:hypothetical protein
MNRWYSGSAMGHSPRCFVMVALVTAGLGALGAGCAPAVPTFPPLPRDAGIECDEMTECPSGQNCLQGVCYAACDATHACGPLEVCTAGVCVSRVGDAGPPRDASIDAPRDAPNDAFDPCVAAGCVDPTPICRGGLCVECNVATDCGPAAPICDVARGVCVAFAPDFCAPCNSDSGCRIAGGMSFGSCVPRVAPEPTEQVCLPACDGATPCPSGFRCDDARMLCVPTTESCTGYHSGVTSRVCTTDADCPQIGATVDDGLITGACSDDGAGSICHYACGLPTDCPSPFSCTAGFCRR